METVKPNGMQDWGGRLPRKGCGIADPIKGETSLFMGPNYPVCGRTPPQIWEQSPTRQSHKKGGVVPYWGFLPPIDGVFSSHILGCFVGISFHINNLQTRASLSCMYVFISKKTTNSTRHGESLQRQWLSSFMLQCLHHFRCSKLYMLITDLHV